MLPCFFFVLDGLIGTGEVPPAEVVAGGAAGLAGMLGEMLDEETVVAADWGGLLGMLGEDLDVPFTLASVLGIAVVETDFL